MDSENLSLLIRLSVSDGQKTDSSKVVSAIGRAVEIPCPTCPTWSHFIQDKLEISTCPGTSINKINSILYFKLDSLI